MCGVVGVWTVKGLGADEQRHLTDMARTLRHRGPDDEGNWYDSASGVGLAHRRLSILDLTADGHQPMVSASGRYVISYNGEIYNYREIERELRERRPGLHLRGHSDTEVLLEAIDEFGLPSALRRFVGMFAFALWDRWERTLQLVRDRLGIKPLYYGLVGGDLAFASELRPLTQWPGFSAELDRGSVSSLLRFGYVPTPRSIYRGISKVRPGTILHFRDARLVDETRYWSAEHIAVEGQASVLRVDDREAVSMVEGALRDAVRLRLVSDVPLGAFLSGGIDSSLVVALMQAESLQPVKTFSIGNLEPGYDESENAAAVAAHLGTDHLTLTATARDALDLIPKLPMIYDEPFADSSQIPTCMVAKLARRHVTVALTGDGGDEVFGGYNRHFWGPVLRARMARVPRAIRVGAARALTAASPRAWDRAFAAVGPLAPRVRLPGDKVHKLARVLGAASDAAMYRTLCSQWDDPESLVLDAPTGPESSTLSGRLDFAHAMMLSDLCTYLPDDILTKVDRATMAVSLEGRVPLLDHRVVELAWRLPLRFKVRGRISKWILRQVLARHLPPFLVDRPKMGFGIPLGDWLRGPLREWAEDLLAPSQLKDVFHPPQIRSTWDAHVSGRGNEEHRLWPILAFQAWRFAAREP